MTLLEVAQLEKRFPAGRGRAIHAVNGVSFTIAPGEILGLVGESGSGKSTIGRLVTRLLRPSSGAIRFQGEDISAISDRKMRGLRRNIQIVFQDPWSSLNPRMSVRRLIEEPFKLHTDLDRQARRDAAEALAVRVRLSPAVLDRYPIGLSGGQLQRVCIARALATSPSLIVLDEPTSSLDLSVRAEILDLLHELRGVLGTAMLFISHDLATIRQLCHRVLVLYLGQVVESAPADALFRAPAHPYTKALLSAQLSPDPRVRTSRHQLEGEVPSAIDISPGCLFESRCPVAIERCKTTRPALEPAGPDQVAACIRIGELKAG